MTMQVFADCCILDCDEISIGDYGVGWLAEDAHNCGEAIDWTSQQDPEAHGDG